MNTPDIWPTWAASPIRGVVTDVITSIRVPDDGRAKQEQSDRLHKVKESHPCVVLDKIVCELKDRGVSLHATRGIARALDLGIRRVYAALPNLRDLRALIVRETACQAKCDPREMLAMRPEDMTDGELEALAADLYEQAEASAELAAGIEAYVLDRFTTRQAARRRMVA